MIEAGGESDYFRDRAAFEIQMAARAQSPEAIRAHRQLAGLYLDRCRRSASDPDASTSRIEMTVAASKA